MYILNTALNGYTLVDLGYGTGTFIKILNPLPIKDGYIISFEESHMAITLNDEQMLIKFLDGPKADMEFIFSPYDSPIKIGRSANCNVKFEDNSLSRY